jgi:hypothetical protein
MGVRFAIMKKPQPLRWRVSSGMALSLAAALGISGVRAAGVAVMKEQPFHRDSSAKPVAYLRIIDSHGPYLRLVGKGRNIDIERSKMADRIEVPDHIPKSLIEEKDIAGLRKSLADMKGFADRYPLSAPLLEPLIVAVSRHLSRFDAGEVRFEGGWITREEFAVILDNRRQESEDRQRREIERLVFNEAQREKGLVLVDGKWLTEQEISERPASARTSLSDALWPLQSPDVDGASFALRNLSNLAASQNGALKVRTERLQRAIRNLFLAEVQLARQIIAGNAAEVKAAAHERHAGQWLKPNVFGTIRKDAARESHAKAIEIRSLAADQLAASREALIAQLREADIVTDDFHKLREHRVALILGETVRAVAARRFPNGEFRSAFPDESLVAIRSSISSPE